MSVRVGINGFGRIGRNVFRAAHERNADIEWVGVNDLTDAKTLAHLLKYDSMLGPYPGTVEVQGDALVVDGKQVKVLAERDPAALPWGDLGAEVVIESTGLFTKRDDAAKHLAAGAQKVVISAPATEPDVTVVLGVNFDEATTPTSTTSSPTRRARPTASRRSRRCCTRRSASSAGLMTTIHAYTADQSLQDMPHKDLRRARAAAINLIPASTGAAKAVGLVLPGAQGQADRLRRPRPGPDRLGRRPHLRTSRARPRSRRSTRRSRRGRHGRAQGHPALHRRPDRLERHRQGPHSSIFDSQLTLVLDGTMVKVVAWYDNEWGYSNRCVDLAQRVLVHAHA